MNGLAFLRPRGNNRCGPNGGALPPDGLNVNMHRPRGKNMIKIKKWILAVTAAVAAVTALSLQAHMSDGHGGRTATHRTQAGSTSDTGWG